MDGLASTYLVEFLGSAQGRRDSKRAYSPVKITKMISPIRNAGVI